LLADYEHVAGAALGLPHISDAENIDFATIGRFRIVDHPATFDAISNERWRNVDVILNHPKYTQTFPEEELAKLAYFSAPTTFSDFKRHVATACHLIHEYTRCKADYAAFEALLQTLENRIEADRPGILRKKGKDGDISYGLAMSDAAEAYRQETGITFQKVKEKAMRTYSEMEERYSHADILFLRDFWQDGRFSGDVNGYLEHLKTNYPKYYNMMHRDIPVHVREEDRKRHTYIVGGTGSGKSELIKLLAHNDITRQQSAVVVIDPHGDMVQQISKWKYLQNDNNAQRLIYIDPFLHTEGTPVLNPFECKGATAQEREVIADQLVNAFEELLKGSAGSSLTLNMRTLLKPCTLVLLDVGGADLLDLQTFLNDDHNADWVKQGQQSPRRAVASFFNKEFHNDSFRTSKESLRNKLQSLFTSSAFCELVNGKSTLNLEKAINQRNVILFNLSKGRIGQDASEALGRFVIAMLKGIAMRRANLPEQQRVPVHLYIDECQNYIGPSIHTLLTETRKYKLHLTMAQQIAGDGMSSELKQVVFNNSQVNFAGFTKKDSNLPQILNVSIEDLQSLSPGQFYCRIGSNPPVKMQAYDHLQQGGANMGNEAWQALMDQQKNQYYSQFNAPEQAFAPHLQQQNSSSPTKHIVDLV